MNRSARTTLAALALTAVAFTSACSAQAEPASQSATAVDASTGSTESAGSSIEQIRETSVANLEAAGFVVTDETLTGKYGDYPVVELTEDSPLYEAALASESKPAHWTTEENAAMSVWGFNQVFQAFFDAPALFSYEYGNEEAEVEAATAKTEWRTERLDPVTTTALEEHAATYEGWIQTWLLGTEENGARLLHDGETPRIQDISDPELVSVETDGGHQLYTISFTVTYNTHFGDDEVTQPGFAQDVTMGVGIIKDTNRPMINTINISAVPTEESAAMIKEQTGIDLL